LPFSIITARPPEVASIFHKPRASSFVLKNTTVRPSDVTAGSAAFVTMSTGAWPGVTLAIDGTRLRVDP
jgi:hypothetical protein